jgi:hypothetical protein
MNYQAGHSSPRTRPNPPWYRARIAAISKLLDELPSSQEKNSPRVLLRNGLVPKDLEKRFNELREFEYKLSFALDSPLSFRELTSFNTWFAINPDKICGKEVVTSSLQFSITVKGTKEDIIKAIRNEESQQQDSSELELEALAIEVELQLLKT